MIFASVEANVRPGSSDIDGFSLTGSKAVLGPYSPIACDMMYKLGALRRVQGILKCKRSRGNDL